MKKRVTTKATTKIITRSSPRILKVKRLIDPAAGGNIDLRTRVAEVIAVRKSVV